MANSGTDPYLCASYLSIVRGFHVYKDIWTPVLNEVHPAQKKHGNPEDRYAVSIVKVDLIVRHIPKELSRICWHFIARDGEITWTMTEVCVVTSGFRDTLYTYTLSDGKSSSIN